MATAKLKTPLILETEFNVLTTLENSFAEQSLQTNRSASNEELY